MQIKNFLFILLFAACSACTEQQQNIQTKKEFQNYIMFNHLYVVVDESSFTHLFDSLKILDDFSRNHESTVDAGAESWSGKYMTGKNHYLEIFKPEGYENAKFGDFGLAFITNKLGTLDSLHNYVRLTKDSVNVKKQVFVEDGKTFPWYRGLSIPNPDSLQLVSWLMEHEKEMMIKTGFEENELEKVIDYWDFTQHHVAKKMEISVDSVQYKKAFDKVTALHLTLSTAELDHLNEYLTVFGFSKKNKTFTGNDIEINYTLSESEHFIVDQIDFLLLNSLPNGKYQFQNVEFHVDGNNASLKFKYNEHKNLP